MTMGGETLLLPSGRAGFHCPPGRNALYCAERFTKRAETGERPMPDFGYLKALRDLYSTADSALKDDGFHPSAGECQVGEFGPQPQPYLLEADLIRASAGRRGLPGPESELGNACPFFAGGQCKIFDVRPFECRSFTGPSRSHWVYHAWRLRLDDLCEDYAAARGEPFRGYPLWMHFGCRRSQPAEWLDVT